MNTFIKNITKLNIMKSHTLILTMFVAIFLSCSDDDNNFSDLEALTKTNSTRLLNVDGEGTVIEKVFTNEVEISVNRLNNYEGAVSFRLNSINTRVDKDNLGFFRTLDMNDNEIDLSEYVSITGDKIQFKVEFSGLSNTQSIFYNLNADDSDWIGNKNLSYVVSLAKQ